MLLDLGGRNPRPFIKIVKNMRRSEVPPAGSRRVSSSPRRRLRRLRPDHVFKLRRSLLKLFGIVASLCLRTANNFNYDLCKNGFGKYVP